MFALSPTPIDAKALKDLAQDPRCGGFVCFEGWVRNHNNNQQVLRLDYQAHKKLAQEQGDLIIQQSLSQFEINSAICVHRIGMLDISEMAIWVGVSAAHRDPAFAACRYILDRVKAEVPIWKKEHWTDGNSGWVEQQ